MTTHILIADADHVLTEVYRDYLTERGFTVRTAADGLGCVAQLRRSRPTLLVLGTSLLWGGCEGLLAVMDEERHLRPEIVLVLAPPRQWHVVRRLRSYGIDSVQWRPLAPVRLVRYVEALLVEHADRQRNFSDLVSGRTEVPAH